MFSKVFTRNSISFASVVNKKGAPYSFDVIDYTQNQMGWVIGVYDVTNWGRCDVSSNR